MKRFVLATLLMTTLFSGVLLAEKLSVLVYPENVELSMYIGNMLTSARPDSDIILSKENRIQSTLAKERGEALDKAYGSEDEQSIQKAEVDFLSHADVQIELPLELSLVSSDGMAYDVEAILSNDRMLLQYICLEKDVDVLVDPVVSRIGSF